MNGKDPHTTEEREVLDLLCSAYSKFIELPVTHPSHKRDFSDGIHKCQHVLMHKLVQRDHSEVYPTLGHYKNT